MSEPLPTPLRRWCMAAAGACLLPLLLQVPTGLAFALGGIAGLGYVFDRRWPGLLRMAVVVMVMGYLLFTFGYNLGRDTGTALLAALLAVKPGETRTLRDARSLLGFSLFAPFAAFLQDQGPLTMALAFPAVGLLLLSLSLMAEDRPGAPAPAFDGRRAKLAAAAGTHVARLSALTAIFSVGMVLAPCAWGDRMGARSASSNSTLSKWAHSARPVSVGVQGWPRTTRIVPSRSSSPRTRWEMAEGVMRSRAAARSKLPSRITAARAEREA